MYRYTLSAYRKSLNSSAAIQLKILIAINRTIKIPNRNNLRLIAPEQETQVCGIE